jgi:hypothetical protein
VGLSAVAVGQPLNHRNAYPVTHGKFDDPDVCFDTAVPIISVTLRKRQTVGIRWATTTSCEQSGGSACAKEPIAGAQSFTSGCGSLPPTAS